MRKLKIYLTFLLVLLHYLGIGQVPFTPGNIVVYRVGTGSATLTGAATEVYLDEFTPSGTLVQSIAMPSVTGNKLTSVGTSSAIDYLNLSTDGRYVVLAGLELALGGTALSTTPKTIGLVDYNGNINVSTVLTNYATVVATSATTDNGTNIWFTGPVGAGYATVGSSTATILVNNNGNRQHITIADGQLYASGLSSTVSIAKIGTGLPTTAGQTATNLPGTAITGGHGGQFVMLDMDAGVAGVDVIYASTGGTVIKYSLVGGTWTQNGTIASNETRGLAAKVSGSTVTLFFNRRGTNATAAGGELVTLVDASGYNGTLSGTPTVISSIDTRFGSADVAAYRGIALVPQAPISRVSVKAFLQGAYNSGLGRHKDVSSNWAAILNANALNQPFNTSAFGNYNGGESVSSGFFTSSGASTDILDWVLVELHDATTPSTIVARKAAFIREDGQIVGLDGTSAVDFTGTPNGNYYLVVRHRNHLSVRSATTIAVNGGSTASYDFTTAQSQAFQDGAITSNAAMKDLGGGVFGLWGGNANSNDNVRFTGMDNDAGVILAALSANQAAVLSSVYNAADINLDGMVRYTGLNNDATALLSVLGANQAAVFTQHQ